MAAALAERIAGSVRGQPLVWLDHFAYSARLLAAGVIPWLDTAACIAYYRKAHALLRPGVAVIPLEEFFDAWLTAHPEALAEMRAKRRAGLVTKALLAFAEPRAVLTEITRAVRQSFPASPLALAMPSPRRWLAWASALAGSPVDVTADVSGDDVESAAVWVAGFLRTFADARVDVLLLDETLGCGPASPEELSWYQPVVNVAKHYRWDVGLNFLDAAFAPAAADGIDFYITRSVRGPLTGVALDEAFWAGQAAPALSDSEFYFARVPRDAVPERVMERLATLRRAPEGGEN